MHYLDAAIGFSVVMGLFSGAATIFVEVLWRLIRIRKGNMIEIIKQLDTELQNQSSANFKPTQRWELFRSILNNPMRSDGQQLKFQLPSAVTVSASKKLPVRFVSTITKGRTVELPADIKSEEAAVEAAISNLNRKHALAGMFERLSSEHVARRYADVFVKAGGQVDDLHKFLNQVITKFEAIYSCMTAEFKRRSQFISIFVGVVAALIFNINGLRILDSFIADPELSKAFVTELDKYETEVLEQIGEAQARLESTKNLNMSSSDDFNDSVSALKSSVTSLSDKGVPIGRRYPPHCTFLGSATCDPGSLLNPKSMVVEWLLLVFTGALLGLGAPFWFDVAQRLSAVRTMFGGKPGATDAKSGRDANGSEETKKQIVDSIVQDAGDNNKMNFFQIYFDVPDKSTVKLRVSDSSGKIACRASLDDASAPLVTWTNNDIKDNDGVDHLLESAAQFYTLTLDLTYGVSATAIVEAQIVDGQGNPHGEPWNKKLTGSAKKTQSIIVTIMMA